MAFFVCASLTAVVQDSAANRYEGIPGRNAFGLKPPLKPEANTPPPQLAKIVLTGITTILGNKRALMKVHPGGTKPAEAKENSLILTEGQREGDIEVIEIDESAGSVKVNNAGTIMTLTFEKDGAKLPATPAPLVAASGLPPVPGGIPVPQPNASNLNPALTNAAGIRPLPTRRFRVPTTQGTPVTTPGAVGTAIGGTAPAVVPPVPGVQTPPTPQDVTPEEQAILQQVQREAAAAAAGSAPNTIPPVPGQPVYPQ